MHTLSFFFSPDSLSFDVRCKVRWQENHTWGTSDIRPTGLSTSYPYANSEAELLLYLLPWIKALVVCKTNVRSFCIVYVCQESLILAPTDDDERRNDDDDHVDSLSPLLCINCTKSNRAEKDVCKSFTRSNVRLSFSDQTHTFCSASIEVLISPLAFLKLLLLPLIRITGRTSL